MFAVNGLVAAVLFGSPAAAAEVDFSLVPSVVGERLSSGWYQLRPAGSVGLSVGERWRFGLDLAAATPHQDARPSFAHTRTWTRASLGLSWAGVGSAARLVVTAGPAVTVRTTRWSEPQRVVISDVGIGPRIGVALERPVGEGLAVGLRSAASSRGRNIDFDAGLVFQRCW